MGIEVREEPVDVHEWHAAAQRGDVQEAFACGTAAVIAPIGSLTTPAGTATMANGEPGDITMRLRGALVDLQEGRADDPFGWRALV
jgi:branched-chain amino acid aminotransferase